MLESGQNLLHYRLVEKIGEGGMGVVWKAVDTNLNREVAIKILPEPLSRDTERLARFEREAKLLATLNHPNIAGVYGLHEAPSASSEQEGVRFIAMELVGGEDLGATLSHGPLSIEDALAIARQTAEALEVAHENGVIHRDLKPANIHIESDGTVKVLDFGLAKAFDAESSSGRSDPSYSPTLTSAGSMAGMVLGTASYMSPEQARGRLVDKRCDIWSFGCVFYELLTGTRLFRGETISDTIALILQTEPDWSSLPPNTPPRLRELLQRCLEKDAKNRVRDIGDARIEIDNALSRKEWTGEIPVASAETGGVDRVSPRRRPLLLASIFVVGALIGAALWWAVGIGGKEVKAPTRVSIESPTGIIPQYLWLTPDGRSVVFLGAKEDPDPADPESVRIFVRPLESPVATPVPETEEASSGAISPDGRWLAYVAPVKPGAAQRRIFKTPLDGSAPPLILADWNQDWPVGMVWLPDDRLLVAARNPVSLVPIATDGSGAGSPVLTDFPETVQELLLHGTVADSAKVFATTYTWEGQGYHDRTYVVDANTGAFAKILEDGSNPRWSDTGHLVFSRQDTLLAVPFDPDSLETTGGPVTLADGLRTGLADASAAFDLSPDGTLVHQAGGRVGSKRRIVVLGDGEEVTPWSEDRLAFQPGARVSSDGRHLATTVMKEDDLLFSVWVSEFDRPRLRLWMAMDGLDCSAPRWLPDGLYLLYDCAGATSERGVYVAPVDGSSPPRFLWRDEQEGNFSTVSSIHPGGGQMLIDVGTPDGSAVLQVPITRDGESGEGKVLLPEHERARAAIFSPDGKWISFFSDDSGRTDLFVAPYSVERGAGRPTLVVSTPQGNVWWLETDAAGVFDLAYMVSPERMNKVRIRTTPRLSVSDPKPFRDFSKIRPRPISFHPLADGKFLAVQRDDQEGGSRRIDLVVNFSTELERLAR